MAGLEEPPQIPGYRLDRMVGEGGFGQVWRAEHGDEIVAIKILHPELVRSVDALTRFRRELEAIERLEHPNVVRALGHGSLDDGRPYLVLEFVEGPSLRDVIHDRGALPPLEVLAILEPLCSALEIAHSAGLVHRDVKASNVILANTAGAIRPVLLDFGLVKLVDQVGPGLTSSRSMLGTPAAMAPEQMKGEPVGPWTDIYALGLLTFHMLTGQPAFGGSPGVVQSYIQLHGSTPRPSSRVDIDPAIDEPVTHALENEPAARFASTRELYEALRDVITPVKGIEADVVAIYVEGTASQVEGAVTLVRRHGWVVALEAPDSMVAVTPVAGYRGEPLRRELMALGCSHVAIGRSRASMSGQLVDGPALDVEGWAPYPLPPGLWVADGL
ncbi:MAG: serine/threonine-protein kinase [Kofleriaceae bacterium]